MSHVTETVIGGAGELRAFHLGGLTVARQDGAPGPEGVRALFNLCTKRSIELDRRIVLLVIASNPTLPGEQERREVQRISPMLADRVDTLHIALFQEGLGAMLARSSLRALTIALRSRLRVVVHGDLRTALHTASLEAHVAYDELISAVQRNAILSDVELRIV
jgi:hypothetical protein